MEVGQELPVRHVEGVHLEAGRVGQRRVGPGVVVPDLRGVLLVEHEVHRVEELREVGRTVAVRTEGLVEVGRPADLLGDHPVDRVEDQLQVGLMVEDLWEDRLLRLEDQGAALLEVGRVGDRPEELLERHRHPVDLKEAVLSEEDL